MMQEWKCYLGTNKGKTVIDLRYPDGSRRRFRIHVEPGRSAEDVFAAWQKDVLPTLKNVWTATVPERPDDDPIVAEFEDGLPENQTNPRISTVIEYYVDKHLRLIATKGTVEQNRQVLREFEQFCKSCRIGRVQQLSLRVVNEYAAELSKRGRRVAGVHHELKPKTVENHLTVIRACLNAALAAGMLTVSPIRKWVMPKVDDPEIRPLTAVELREVLELIRTHEPEVYNVVTYMAYSGQRTSDARSLRLAHVDLKAGVRYKVIKKTGTRRVRDLSPKAIAAIRAEMRRGRVTDTGPIFTNAEGRPFPKNQIARAFKRALVKGRFYRHVRLHDLRHTFAYLLINYTNCSLATAQEQLDHESIKTTMRYCKPSPARTHLVALDTLVDQAKDETIESGQWRVV